jgi:hypothetical protein
MCQVWHKMDWDIFWTFSQTHLVTLVTYVHGIIVYICKRTMWRPKTAFFRFEGLTAAVLSYTRLNSESVQCSPYNMHTRFCRKTAFCVFSDCICRNHSNFCFKKTAHRIELASTEVSRSQNFVKS